MSPGRARAPQLAAYPPQAGLRQAGPQQAGPVRSPASDRAAAPLTVAVLASDPITAEGTIAYLRARAGITPVTADRLPDADVILILATWVTEETLSWMQRAAAQSAGGEARFVLVGEGVREYQLLRAVSCGLVSIIPRQAADHERIVAAILAVREGRVDMPPVAVGWLAGQIRTAQRNALAHRGLATSGLEARELDVLRLLADGLDTQQIAAQLSYSERTVKNIIHGLLSRLKLRNRPHAVAFALRNGLI
jgi:DNA-binding NarL/FixJ family response regulator